MTEKKFYVVDMNCVDAEILETTSLVSCSDDEFKHMATQQVGTELGGIYSPEQLVPVLNSTEYFTQQCFVRYI